VGSEMCICDRSSRRRACGAIHFPAPTGSVGKVRSPRSGRAWRSRGGAVQAARSSSRGPGCASPWPMRPSTTFRNRESPWPCGEYDQKVTGTRPSRSCSARGRSLRTSSIPRRALSMSEAATCAKTFPKPTWTEASDPAEGSRSAVVPWGSTLHQMAADSSSFAVVGQPSVRSRGRSRFSASW
jgi:hypothetical protein